MKWAKLNLNLMMIKLPPDEYSKYDLSDVVGENYQLTNTNMIPLLKWLSGKKSIIAGLITTTSAYLVDMGTIDPKTGAYIATISLIVFGTASVATGKFIYNK